MRTISNRRTDSLAGEGEGDKYYKVPLVVDEDKL
jgi:hypothetical protein